MDKKYFIGFAALIIIIIGVLLISRTSVPLPREMGKIRVITSFYPLFFFSEAIGGEKATVINLTPAGTEPHDYEPTAQDTALVEQSDLVILNGGGLEAWGERMKENLDPARTRVIVAADGLKLQQIREQGEKVIDPHLWLSPLLAGQMVDSIAKGFIAVDPPNTDYYESRIQALKTRLEALHTKYQEGLRECVQRNIVTAHAAFGYLAATYHLNQISIAGVSPESEPSPRRLKDIADFVGKNQIWYIFFERLVSPKLAQTIARETGAKTLVLNPIEGLTDEELTQGKNYFTEMEQNLAHLQTALQCKK